MAKKPSRAFVQRRLEELGCDPIEALVTIGQRALDENDLSNARDCYKDLLSYIHPKLKAVEVSGPEGGAIAIQEVVRKIVEPRPTDS